MLIHFNWKKLMVTLSLFAIQGAFAMQGNEQRLGVALVAATEDGNVAQVRRLIELGAPVNGADPRGFTALILAADEGHLGIVQILLDHGANVNAKAATGEGNKTFALRQAAQNGHDQIVRLLVDKDADVDMADAEGATSLLGAAESGHIRSVQILLDHGANVNAQAANGVFALKQAAQSGHDQIVRLLADEGADVNMADARGVTSLMCAAQNGHLGIVQFLLDHGANVNAQTAKGLFTLRQAAQNGHLGVVEALLAHVSEADGRPMRVAYFALASSMKKKHALDTSPDTRRLVLRSFIDALVQNRMDELVVPMIVLQDCNERSARDIAQVNGHLAIADLLDLNNPQSQKKIRTLIEANIRRAIKTKPIRLYPNTQGISWDEALGVFEPREEGF
jgi:ankyrin repeat protein